MMTPDELEDALQSIKGDVPLLEQANAAAQDDEHLERADMQQVYVSAESLAADAVGVLQKLFKEAVPDVLALCYDPEDAQELRNAVAQGLCAPAESYALACREGTRPLISIMN